MNLELTELVIILTIASGIALVVIGILIGILLAVLAPRAIERSHPSKESRNAA